MQANLVINGQSSQDSQAYLFRKGREDKYPYYVVIQNPNQGYQLLKNEKFYQPYHELLTDGKLFFNTSGIYVQEAKFVIVREMKLGRYQFANLFTEQQDVVSLSYYGYLTSTSYHHMKKLTRNVYQLKR